MTPLWPCQKKRKKRLHLTTEGRALQLEKNMFSLSVLKAMLLT